MGEPVDMEEMVRPVESEARAGKVAAERVVVVAELGEESLVVVAPMG
jgi:hypothetical protein